MHPPWSVFCCSSSSRTLISYGIPCSAFLFPMKLDTCNNRCKLWSLQCKGVRQCFQMLRLPPTHRTDAGYSTPEHSSVRTSRRTPFEFDHSGAATCNFSVGDVTNSWQQCRCSCLTGKTECLNLTNQRLFKFNVDCVNNCC